jgi:hypothetical protein
MSTEKMKMKKISVKGYVLIYLLFTIVMFSFMSVPVINIILKEMRVLTSTNDKENALQVAEAGINYYVWRLAHYPNDYQDGTGNAGPYLHDYKDYDTNQTIGQFSLTITPPPSGSTIVTIKSTGWATVNPSIKRTITAKFGVQSMAKYAFLSNDIIWIGSGESISGQMMANNGIRFDGTGNAPIQSAKLTYTCPVNQGNPCPAVKDGVWGSATQAVKNFWKFPVPAVDFSSFTADLASIKSKAQSSGIYLAPSNAQGYSLVFNSNATVSIYKVTKLQNGHNGWDVNGNAHNESVDYKTRVLLSTQAIPANGFMYIEDKVWVEGTVRGRVTVAASKLPYNASTAPTIYIPQNLVYSAKDGSDALGLISQKDIIVTYDTPADLEVDAALLAQNGSVGFLYYPNNKKNSIYVFGSIITFGQWTWTWVSNGNVVSGFATTNSVYDGNLLYSPPPGFPVSSGGYQLISWISD